MAELIDKRTTRKIIEKYFESLAPSHYYKMDLEKASAYLDAEIAELPTTTEAEIRAKAIDEFAERISTFGTYDYHGNKIDVLEIARQLKEE